MLLQGSEEGFLRARLCPLGADLSENTRGSRNSSMLSRKCVCWFRVPLVASFTLLSEGPNECGMRLWAVWAAHSWYRQHTCASGLQLVPESARGTQSLGPCFLLHGKVTWEVLLSLEKVLFCITCKFHGVLSSRFDSSGSFSFPGIYLVAVTKHGLG